MPVTPTGLEEPLAQAAAVIHAALHPFTWLLGRLGFRAPGDLDLAAWALLSWLLGSREGEAVKKLGLVVAAALAALAALEAVLRMG